MLQRLRSWFKSKTGRGPSRGKKSTTNMLDSQNQEMISMNFQEQTAPTGPQEETAPTEPQEQTALTEPQEQTTLPPSYEVALEQEPAGRTPMYYAAEIERVKRVTYEATRAIDMIYVFIDPTGVAAGTAGLKEKKRIESTAVARINRIHAVQIEQSIQPGSLEELYFSGGSGAPNA